MKGIPETYLMKGIPETGRVHFFIINWKKSANKNLTPT
jgi:hypothetical protein